jgi:hypothetical protein
MCPKGAMTMFDLKAMQAPPLDCYQQSHQSEKAKAFMRKVQQI